MWVLNVKRAIPLTLVFFVVVTGAAALGASAGSTAFGPPARSALLVAVLGLIAVIGFIGYRMLAEK